MQQVKIRNKTHGPLAIMQTWRPGRERTLIKSDWKKKEDGFHRSYKAIKVHPPEAFNLAAGAEVVLPRAAANSPQIVGLHRAGLISVVPVEAQDTPQRAKREPATQDKEEAAETPQEADDGATTETDTAGQSKSRRKKGRGRSSG